MHAERRPLLSWAMQMCIMPNAGPNARVWQLQDGHQLLAKLWVQGTRQGGGGGWAAAQQRARGN